MLHCIRTDPFPCTFLFTPDFMIELLRQFTQFIGVGCMSAIGHYGLMIILVQAFAVGEVKASAAGAVLGALINYALNYRFTFRSNKRHRESLAKFAVVATIGLGWNTLFMWIGVVQLGINYVVSQLITTGLVMIWSFAANRYWTFHVGHAAK